MTLLILVAFVLVGIGAIIYGYVQANARIHRIYQPEIAGYWADAPPGDPVRGARFVNGVVRCGECHAPDLGGKVVVDSGLGTIVAPNITAGGRRVGTYDLDDWIRAIRHGVEPDGRGLWLMPVTRLRNIDRRDLADMVAYLQTTRSVGRQPGESELSLFGKTAVGYGRIPLIAAETLSSATTVEATEPRLPVAVGPTVVYGRYLAEIAGCAECHGADLAGLAIDEMQAPALRGGNAATWELETMTRLMRTGQRPDGSSVDDNLMPIRDYMLLTDLEIEALWRFIRAPP